MDSRSEPVTDTDSTAGATITSRNDPFAWHREAAAKIAIRRAQVWASADTGETCGDCGRALAPDERVWRVPLWTGWGKRSLAVRCVDCQPEKHREGRATECVGCGRPVVWANPRMPACSVRCVGRGWNRYRRAGQVRDPVPCVVCGETFKPTRKDARYCSSACRQRAYRGRVPHGPHTGGQE